MVACSGASIDALPSELVYVIARAHLPALCALRACSKPLRLELARQLEAEPSLWIVQDEVTLGSAELLAALPSLSRVTLAKPGLWGGCESSRKLRDPLVSIDMQVLREATSVCVKPALPTKFSGNESCTWAVELHERPLQMNAEVVALLCAPVLRANRRLIKLVTRSSSASLGPSHINVALIRSGQYECWSQIFESATRSHSPETPHDNFTAVLVAGILTSPLPLELRVDLTGLRAVSGAALAFAEARSGRRFVRPQLRQASAPSPVLHPTSLARTKLFAARSAHRIPWGLGPSASGVLDEIERPSERLRPRLTTMGSGPLFGDRSPLALPLSLPALVISAWVAQRWHDEHSSLEHSSPTAEHWPLALSERDMSRLEATLQPADVVYDV